MEIVVLSVASSKEEWALKADETYSEKITHHIKFKDLKIKSKKIERDDKDRKVKAESAAIMDQLQNDDFVVLCDEAGRPLGSIELASKMRDIIDRGAKRIVFIIGGAFGVEAVVKKRANLMLSMSTMTMNHLVAKVVLLEQIYRVMMILRGKPYHNE